MSEELHTQIDRAIPWVAAIVAALPCFYLSWVLVKVWSEPMAWDDGEIGHWRDTLHASRIGYATPPDTELGITDSVLNEVYPGRGGGIWGR